MEVLVANATASKFHQIPDALWERLEPLLPKYKRSPKGGKPRLPLRNVANGIFFVLVTGCQWKAMPHEFGSGSAVNVGDGTSSGNAEVNTDVDVEDSFRSEDNDSVRVEDNSSETDDHSSVHNDSNSHNDTQIEDVQVDA